MKQLKWIGLIIIISIIQSKSEAKAQDIMKQNQGFTSKQKSIIFISLFTAKGRLENLKKELNTGLEVGLTVNEIKEILVHCYAYCGFPRSISGLQTFMKVMDERKAKGIKDNLGTEALPITSDSSKYERGKKILGDLTGRLQPDKLSGYAAFSSIIDTFLKEHLFADIFERNVLTYAQRELVTISVISAIGDAEPMLQSHLAISLKVGISAIQLKEFIEVIKSKVGEKESNAARIVLEEVLKK